MDTKETNVIKESLFKLPELVKKIEAYFNVEKPEAPKVDEPAKEEVIETANTEQDFSAVITAIEKNFTKSSDFEAFKTSLTEASTKVTETFATLTTKNEALEAKFTKQDEVIKEIFELIKKIGDTPAEESKFSKKDGAPKVVELSKMDRLMAEAKELSKQTFKN